MAGELVQFSDQPQYSGSQPREVSPIHLIDVDVRLRAVVGESGRLHANGAVRVFGTASDIVAKLIVHEHVLGGLGDGRRSFGRMMSLLCQFGSLLMALSDGGAALIKRAQCTFGWLAVSRRRDNRADGN